MGVTTPVPALPAPRILYRTLRAVTEALARELATPGTAEPHWNEFEWSAARAVAVMQGISSLLAVRSAWHGDCGWTDFLRLQREHVAQRHRRIRHTLEGLDQAARSAGIPVLALKGSALHALGIYQPGDRPMADIDLLVTAGDQQRCAALLQTIDFAAAEDIWKHQLFVPVQAHDATPSLGEHRDSAVKIDLHTRISERLPLQITMLRLRLFPPQRRPGVNGYASPAALMAHLLLHAAGTMPTRALRMIQIHDMAALSRRMTDPDWLELTTAAGVAPCWWWAYPPLRLVQRYYGCVPAPVLAAMRAHCPRRLRRVTSLFDASLSYPWVEAFPGIQWSRSIGEWLRYAVQRVRPPRSLMAQRARVANRESWARADSWSHRPQLSRILRWIGTRPTRPATLYALRLALAEERAP